MPAECGQEARRRAASHALRSFRRSSSEVPPQTPDSWLVAEREVEARLLCVAPSADPFGRLDLVDSRAGGADGEEEIGFGAATSGQVSPVTVVPVDRPVPHKGHVASSAPISRGSRL